MTLPKPTPPQPRPAGPNEVVDVADCKIGVGAHLVTYALGSCIAVTVHDSEREVGGLLHFKLPDSAIEPAKAEGNPYLFADTGIKSMLKRVCDLGANKKKLQVCLAGGAQMFDDPAGLQIGKRNYLAARKVLWKEGVMVSKEAIGGEVSRSITLVAKTGCVTVRLGGSLEPVVLHDANVLGPVGAAR